MENMVDVHQSITHTFDLNQVKLSRLLEGISSGPSHHSRKGSVDVGDSELLHMVRKQEMAWESAEEAVHKLDRRLRMLERSDSMNKSASFHVNIPDKLAGVSQFPLDIQSPMPSHFRCIYVTPIHDDKKGSIMYRTHIVEDGGNGFRSRSFSERVRGDEKDVEELKRLSSEVQRQDLEIRKLKAEMKRLRALESEDDRNSILDKFVDKVNTVRPSISISRPWSYHDALQHVRSDLNSSFASSEGSAAESLNGPAYSVFDSQSLSVSHCGTPRSSNLVPGEPLRTSGEKRLAPAAVPDLDRCALSPDGSNSNSAVYEIIRSLLSTLHVSVENLSNNIKLREPRDSDSSKIDCGAIDDEIFILKKTLNKLEEVCQESGYESFRRDQAKAEKLENVQTTIGVMLQQLAQAEFKAVNLESSSMEKDRKVEDLESRIHVVLKEREALMIEKYECTTVIREMQKETEEQRHRIEELLSINEELLEISQTEENKLGTSQEMKNHLIQQVMQYEDNCATLESLLQEKEKELEDLNRRLKAGQIGADSIIFEKFELLNKVQAMQAEAEEQKSRINELVSINEELLEYAQKKENELSLMSLQVQRLQAHCGEISEAQAESSAVQENEDKDSCENASQQEVLEELNEEAMSASWQV